MAGLHVAMLFLVAGLLGGCADEREAPSAPAGVVNFYNWFDYIHPDTLPSFTRETGIVVNYDTYDADDTLEAKLVAGNSGYDVVVPTSTYLARQREAGLYREIDWSRLPHASGIDRELLARLARIDPGNRFAVPHSWGTTGLILNVARIRERLPDVPLDSWALVFEPAIVRHFADCGVALLDSPGDVLQSILLYLSRDPRSERDADLAATMDVMRRVLPHVRYFHSSALFDDLASGELCLALGWSGQAMQAMRAAPATELRYVIPKEGAILWFETMAIPRDAVDVDNAHRLIDYLLRPDVAADFTRAAYYPSAITAAIERVDPELRAQPAIYPPPETMARLHAVPPESRAFERKRLRAWMTMKGQGGDR